MAGDGDLSIELGPTLVVVADQIHHHFLVEVASPTEPVVDEVVGEAAHVVAVAAEVWGSVGARGKEAHVEVDLHASIRGDASQQHAGIVSLEALSDETALHDDVAVRNALVAKAKVEALIAAPPDADMIQGEVLAPRAKERVVDGELGILADSQGQVAQHDVIGVGEVAPVVDDGDAALRGQLSMHGFEPLLRLAPPAAFATLRLPSMLPLTRGTICRGSPICSAPNRLPR